MRDALVVMGDEVDRVERRRKLARWWAVCQPELPPRGRQYSARSGAGEAPTGGCGWQSRAPDHWRALECQSQRPVERRRGRRGRPRQATGCGNERGEPSREECLLFVAAERG